MWAWGISDPRQLEHLTRRDFHAMADQARKALSATPRTT